MTDSEQQSLEFYREQYLFEHERARFYDRLIQYPTTLLVIFVAGAFYSYSSYFGDAGMCLCTWIDWFFLIFFSLFWLSIIITIWFLATVFHGFTRKYDYLPFTGSLLKREKQLYKHNYRYSEKKDYKEKREDAIASTISDFSKDLKMYYVELTETNQIINDKRADSYYLTRTFLFIDLILLMIIGITGFVN